MKLVLLTPFYFPSMGGVQETFRLFGEYFVKKGWKVQVHTSQLQGIDDVRITDIIRVRNFMPYQVKDGVEIFRYDGGGLTAALLGLFYAVSYRLKLPITGTLFRAYRLRGMRKNAMLKNIAKFKPDVILVGPCVDFMMSLALSAKELTGAKLIVHNALHLDDSRQLGLDEAVRQLMKADVVQANTEFEKDYLIKKGISTDKICAFGPAVDVTHFMPPLDETRADGRIRNKIEGKKYIFYLGRKEEGKGVGTLIKAVDEARRSHPELNLVLAGPETIHSRRDLSAIIASRFYIHNFGRMDLPTKRWLYHHAALFAMVSHVDSFGIVYCESWLCKRPVLGADNDQMRCVIQDGETGFLVPYGDSKKLAQVIVAALDDPARLDKMGEKGYQHVINTFANQAIEKRMFETAQKLVSTSR
jgi:glycosyltransferase involved in cell wall biosynthesis